ncbi:hypothetical protein Sjap_003850 [Stephania japonica]|uniref:Oligopeptide transporter n=1 Tax=Stephania japonica TaxID=461633 RepID=A0AAP0PVF0_9MAGN
MAGFIIIVYILLPVAYWTNSYGAKKFPFISSHVFSYDGQPYNISRILNTKTFSFDQEAYDSYSKVNLSIFFVFTYGLSFATFASRSSTKNSSSKANNSISMFSSDQFGCKHEICSEIILAVAFVLSVIACEGLDKQLQLPYWGIILAMALAFIFTLPIGIITATTNQEPGLNVITELIIGYLYPGKPLANVAFKTYGTISVTQAIMFLSDFKLGHYMKVQ